MTAIVKGCNVVFLDQSSFQDKSLKKKAPGIRGLEPCTNRTQAILNLNMAAAVGLDNVIA